MKKVAIIMAIILLFSSLCITVSAEENNNIYMETRKQINLKNISLKNNNGNLKIEINKSNFIDNIISKNRKKDIEVFLDEYPMFESNFLKYVEEGVEICAISYTDAPVFVNEDGQIERIKKDKSILLKMILPIFLRASAVESETTKDPTIGEDTDGNFVLTTFVLKNNSGQYIVETVGEWKEGSWLGGAKYPASGKDYVWQTIPSNFTHIDHYFLCGYVNTSEAGSSESYLGEEGTHYSFSACKDNYLEYKIKDDPFGLARLESFVLSSRSQGSSTGKYRCAYSYYIHTWTSVNVDVSVQASTANDGTVTLVLNPNLVEKSWQVSNYVSFNF